ncbi:MAG: site-2 protease family protein [Clostridia bacterium]|nr:site-2 protease family protein [Clostridia bacterium]
MEILKYLIFLLAAMLCIILHEFAHAYVALLNGDPTARKAGRLTLNPVRHFDLFGFLLFAVFRIGYAKAVPITPYYFKNRKVGIITVALSGVVLNLLISFLMVPVILLLAKFLYPVMSDSIEGLRGYELMETFFTSVCTVGVSLFLFNLLPMYPLDGYNVIESIFGCTHPFVRWLRDFAMYIFICVAITFYVAELFGLPDYFNPGYWYMEFLGGKIIELFYRIWLPLFV